GRSKLLLQRPDVRLDHAPVIRMRFRVQITLVRQDGSPSMCLGARISRRRLHHQAVLTDGNVVVESRSRAELEGLRVVTEGLRIVACIPRLTGKLHRLVCLTRSVCSTWVAGRRREQQSDDGSHADERVHERTLRRSKTMSKGVGGGWRLLYPEKSGGRERALGQGTRRGGKGGKLLRRAFGALFSTRRGRQRNRGQIRRCC